MENECKQKYSIKYLQYPDDLCHPIMKCSFFRAISQLTNIFFKIEIGQIVQFPKVSEVMMSAQFTIWVVFV